MRELIAHMHRRRLRSTLIWGVALAITSALIVASFTTMDPESMRALTESFDPKLLEAFGATAESIATPEGYMAAQLLAFMPLIVGFFPILAAGRGIAGAEADGTLDVLVTQPVPRWQVPVAIGAAFTIGLVELLAIYVAGTWLAAVAFGVDLSPGSIAVSAVGLLPISLAFGGLALALSALVRRSGQVTAIVGGLLVASYLLQTIVLLVPDIDALKVVTAFHWYGSPIEDGLHTGGSVLLLIVAGLGVGASTALFARRDILA